VKKRPQHVQKGKEGLLHGPLRIEIEDVTLRHKKECLGCGSKPPPTERRLKLVGGSGRAAQTSIYCAQCGAAWLVDHVVEVERARSYLAGAEICVRLTRQKNGK